MWVKWDGYLSLAVRLPLSGRAQDLHQLDYAHFGRTRREAAVLGPRPLALKRRRPPTLPHCIAVPSAQAGLTSLFGMGRGGTPPQ